LAGTRRTRPRSQVAVEDALADHRVAEHAQREGLAAAEQLLGQGHGLGHLDRLDGRPRRHPPEERDGDRGAGGRRLRQLERAAVVREPPDAPFALEVGQVLVHGGQRAQREMPSDLVERGRVAVLGDVRAQEVEQLLLSLGEHPQPLLGPAP